MDRALEIFGGMTREDLALWLGHLIERWRDDLPPETLAGLHGARNRLIAEIACVGLLGSPVRDDEVYH